MISTLDISQSEADLLFSMEKCRINDDTHKFPTPGKSIRIPLKSKNQDENFSLDIRKMRIQLTKHTFQTRGRKILILARIDLNGAPHRNPNGEEIPCPHIHLYKEGYDDKWAYSLPESFTNPNDIMQTLEEFMRFCNITQVPYIEKKIYEIPARHSKAN